QCDLRVITAETFGAGLHYFTGNKQHNIQLRTRANRMKLQMSEHGVWERKLFGRGQGEDNRKIARRIVAGRTEEELFRSLGLPFIPPEIREGDGEIEAAAEGKLPRLVEAGDLQGDLHLRPRSLAEASALLHAAKAAGLAYVCFVLDAADLDAWSRELRLLEQSVGVRALTGVVAHIGSDGSVAKPHDGADLVFGVVDDDDGEDRSERLVTAIESGVIDVVHRATGRVLLHQSPPPVELWALLKAAARGHVLVEVGGDPARLDLDARGCRTNIEVGATLSIASEASDPDDMPRRAGFALSQARRGWIGKELVGNAWPLAQLEQWLRNRPRAAERRERRVLLGAWLADDPLGAQLAAEPLDDVTVARLQEFLAGKADAPLERALARSAGNALQRAFELVARARG
ncbi:MAG TPA: hypothetical protein VGO62_17275, partial [Myxococcota bacterium]